MILYLDKNIKISSNKIAKLGHKTIIHIGKTPTYKDVLKLYMSKNTNIESNKYPKIEIKSTVWIVFFLLSELIKQIVKNNRPHIKPGR